MPSSWESLHPLAPWGLMNRVNKGSHPWGLNHQPPTWTVDIQLQVTPRHLGGWGTWGAAGHRSPMVPLPQPPPADLWINRPTIGAQEPIELPASSLLQDLSLTRRLGLAREDASRGGCGCPCPNLVPR